jgi:cytochrome c peroxidase
MRFGWSTGLILLGLILPPFLVVLGCQPAARYNPDLASALENQPKGPEPIPDDYAWLPPLPNSRDIPILFLDAVTNADEWNKLEKFWNWVPLPGTGQSTIHFGLPPLQAVSALVLTEQVKTVIKIKVPLGLPNPAKLIPAANPPTLLKWSLGRRLFFDKSLLSPGRELACASCHNPKEGFTENGPVLRVKMKAPSLINCAFNQTQFWDGRVTYLEEVVQRSLEDERPGVKPDPQDDVRHAWKGIVGRLRGSSGDYPEVFRTVFGTYPTQDNVAKALATYLRTILSANSLHDKAERERQGKQMEAKHYEKWLTPETARALERPLTPSSASQLIFQGYQLFHGKARCSLCHPAPLFTNHDFHNAGVRESADAPETSGRIVIVPIGVKDQRLEGAFKTPALRGLLQTSPFMHDGSLRTLDAVIKYFNTGLEGGRHLDPLLRMSDGLERGRSLGLGEEEVRALVLFLKALDGEPVDPLIAAGP